jgi:hypothetical protein
MGRGCYGCFGPAKDVNTTSLSTLLQQHEKYPGETGRLFRGISGYAPAFRKAADELLSTSKETK